MILAENSYGKSRIRIVKVIRHPDRHDLKEITIQIRFEGDFKTCFTEGDNGNILPTDTMKNTVYALAKNESVEPVEAFGLRLTEFFLNNNPQVLKVTVDLVEHLWTRMNVGGRPHHFSFVNGGNEKHTATITGTRDAVTLEAGIADLVMMKTTHSSFEGFMTDPFTTLKETNDRILGTAMQVRWRYREPDIAYGPCWHGVRQVILDTFAEHDSKSVQHTLHAIGEAVLNLCEEVEEIHISMPNKHCLLVDLSIFGLDNKNEIFLPVDEPHGIIEARLKRA